MDYLDNFPQNVNNNNINNYNCNFYWPQNMNNSNNINIHNNINCNQGFRKFPINHSNSSQNLPQENIPI